MPGCPGVIAPVTLRSSGFCLGSAAELVVTLDTVKKHVSHLLGKLGAANRTEAVTRARLLGLIPWHDTRH
jgi:hypothetical protein